MRIAIRILIIMALAGFPLTGIAQTIEFTDNWSPNPLFTVVSQSETGIELIFSTHQVVIEEREVDGVTMQHYGVPGIFLSNDEGAPDIPGTGRWIAIPQGAEARLKVLETRTDTLHNVEICPAPNNPPESDDSPLRYVKNQQIYGTNAFYPESPAKLSAPTQIRGVDAAIVGVSPMQYNPVTKDLIIYKDMRIKIDFIGGNGHFGEDRLRSRYWEQILQGQFINYESLPRIDFSAQQRSIATDNVEYIIIIPNDTIFAAWADTLKNWRQLQGISTSVFTLAQIGGTDSAHIKSFLRNAYNTWSPAPVAFLILSDFPNSGLLTYGVTSPRVTHPDVTRMASDNWYADFNSDGLPELHIARICAKTQAHLSTIINKMLNYERNPPIHAGYYNNPLVACGWQTERWFQLCSEVIRGFLITGLGKTPVKQYKIYSGTPTIGGQWSTATNTATVVNYWYNVGWLPSTTNQNNSSWWNNGTAAGINNAINAGAFLVQHRDHGAVEGWGEPSYDTSSLNGLDNSLLPYVFTTNCETGYFDYSSRQSFTEKFHRISGGALGLNAATRISYSFVNDVFCWGMYDCMWPQFDPNYPIINSVGYQNLRPAFANSYGKYYLAAHSWPYNTEHKSVTYGLFHHHGDPFMTIYAAIPETLTVVHDATIGAGQTVFTVTANDSSIIALTAGGEIYGVAEGTGAPVNIAIPSLSTGDTLIVTVTKAGYRRYSARVAVTSGALTPITQIPLSAEAKSTAIAAGHDTIICAYDQQGAILNGRISQSNDGGLTWTNAFLDDTTIISHSAKVISSEGKIGVAYLANQNPRQGRFIQSENGIWSTPTMYSDIEPIAVRPAVEFLGDDGYGVVYIGENEQYLAKAFFDRLAVGGGCDYLLGDINGDDEVLASDVTYGVRFFKGLGTQPPDSCYLDSAGIYYYAAGDVNGNCEFRGSDITTLVAILTGHAQPKYCHWNPPVLPPRIKHNQKVIKPE